LDLRKHAMIRAEPAETVFQHGADRQKVPKAAVFQEPCAVRSSPPTP
jgi:hypothetical protein